MSDFEQKDNSGSLFKNDRKEKDTHPDYKGTAKLAGVEYWMSAWMRESANKTKYMSFAFTPKEAQASAPANTIDDDENPF